MTTSIALVLTTLSLSVAYIYPVEDCPVLGPSFPPDLDTTQATSFQETIKHFSSLIDLLFDSGALDRSTSSFHIDVFTTHTNGSISSYSYSGELLQHGLTAGILNDGAIFRIGSVSKLYTAYALLNLAAIGILDHPVTRYLPKLPGNTTGPRMIWKDVTLGALAARQGGTGDFTIEDAVYLSTRTCSNEAFLERMRDLKRPVIPVFQTAMYSDAGFGILGRIIERLTYRTYTEALQTYLTNPLGLRSTSVVEPQADGLNALASPGDATMSSWGQDNLITAPSGKYTPTHKACANWASQYCVTSYYMPMSPANGCNHAPKPLA